MRFLRIASSLGRFRRPMVLLFALLAFRGSLLRADVFKMPAGSRSLELVDIGNPGNAADDTGYGSVSYPYRIGKYEVTAAQYVEFLNAVAREQDPHGLYSNNMEETAGCGVDREGTKGNYRYSVKPELANRPVNHLNFWDACRFCNWLHNGQGSADTETGAYTLHGYSGSDGRKIVRNPDARYFVPDEDEWYKAAYYDPKKSGGAGYWDYPTRSDQRGDRDRNSPHGSNRYDDAGYLDTTYYLFEAGSFPNAASGYGTFDQAGNVMEWNETTVALLQRGLRGGAYCTRDGGLNVRPVNNEVGLFAEKEYVGFRVAASLDGHPATGSRRDATSSANPPLLSFARRPWRDPQTGKPFFPMGWYAWESDEADLEQLEREGANTILFVGSPTDLDRGEEQYQVHLRAMKEYLDAAHRHHMKVIMQNGWREAFSDDSDPGYVERVKRFVAEVKDHPALLAYQLYDEPEYRTENGLNEHVKQETARFVRSIGQTRDLIRSVDNNPHRSIQVVFNLVPMSAYNWFLPSIDGFQIDRYPIWANSPFMGQQGDWGPLYMAWAISHGARQVRSTGHLNPVPVMQGIGLSHDENRDGTGHYWRNPTYDETRYMAYSSLTAGGWGFLHWIRNSSCEPIKQNVARVHQEFRKLIPALEQSYENPPFAVRHAHTGLSRNFLTDSVPDISTLELEDADHYYLIVSDNSGTFEDVEFELSLPAMERPDQARRATVMHEFWSRPLTYHPDKQTWTIPRHTMCFGDINVWMIPKRVAP
jgi:formylglycine-generating enzyme required for sulfatase activity